MRFGPTPLDEAEGAILAHTLRLPDGTVLRKSHRLDAGDVARLRDSGFAEPVTVRLDPGDMDEDDAAGRIAAGLAGPCVRVETARTGRCNLVAEADGLLLVEANRIGELNRLDEGIQVATLAPFATVRTGALVATVKVVPFAVPASLVRAVEAPDPVAPAVRVAAFRPLRAALFLTRLSGTPRRALDVARARVTSRVAALGGTVESVAECEHAARALADALREAISTRPDLVLIFGASATVDRNDVVPAGLEEAGGLVARLGMPVDPGNLLLLGSLGEVPVVGVPGCARSPAPSGFDRVLARLFAGLPPGAEEVAAMGVGGLLRESGDRPSPRRPARPTGPSLAGVVLAAGFSHRMGAKNKLLAPVGGVPMVRGVAQVALAAALDPVVVVTGHDADAVEAALEGLDVVVARNDQPEAGLSASLATGLGAVGSETAGAVVLLADMPFVRPAHIASLTAAFDPSEGASICVPVHGRRRGNPVLWASRYFPEMSALSGDQGARTLLTENADEVREVPVDDAGILRDIDTAGDLLLWEGPAEPSTRSGGPEGASAP